ncbi:hypothetical protein PTSG_08068 [Salpingoeca rosetta]|uniref:Hint domain-containing protein n=1 Tax=Salpingoeca rosetta (strain ATCC 50818 / BSB-021) TaxID=946362 RepID=F2UHW8_SALR5|nr:uncharacterized protein PTSG_08068 [Salpingoeca rosetta]EGD76717.1 hypothetical protein PTSG_08068 [Salpingoeca rosetta]|eukprot:XP_004991089.1 hypothetical protein PTSG_08068 [Salpingoeca rosetta]
MYENLTSSENDFWSIALSNGTYGADYAALEAASETGVNVSVTTGQLDGAFTHVCSARPSDSTQLCPLIATDPPSTAPCFPGWAEVILESGERVQLRDLKTGDHVLCLSASNGNSLAYCDMKTFINVQHNKTSPFVELHYTDKDGNASVLTSTPDHFIFRAGEDVDVSNASTTKPAGDFIFAEDFVVGDRLVRYDDAGFVYTVAITSITETTYNEFYSPVTNDGSTLFVDDVFASSFAFLASAEALRKLNAPIWQNDDARFSVPTPGSDFPVGLHPFVAERARLIVQANVSDKTIDFGGLLGYIGQKLAQGHIFSEQEMLDLIPTYIS